MKALLLAMLVSVLSLPAAADVPAHGAANGQPPSAAVAANNASGAPVAFDAPPPVGTRATCPVTDGVFRVTGTTPRSDHGGKHFVFCRPECKPKFDADPAGYLVE